MPELTRRRSLDAREECWHVWYGDVRVGTIAIRTGMPPGEDPWGWACGFYPGSHPGECTDGTAEKFRRSIKKDFFDSIGQANVRRYRKLLNTQLTDIERNFIERRLVEELHDLSIFKGQP